MSLRQAVLETQVSLIVYRQNRGWLILRVYLASYPIVFK